MKVILSLNDIVKVKLTHVGAEIFNVIDNAKHDKYIEGDEVDVQLADLINPAFLSKNFQLPFEIHLDTNDYSYRSIFRDPRLIKHYHFKNLITKIKTWFQ